MLGDPSGDGLNDGCTEFGEFLFPHAGDVQQGGGLGRVVAGHVAEGNIREHNVGRHIAGIGDVLAHGAENGKEFFVAWNIPGFRHGGGAGGIRAGRGGWAGEGEIAAVFEGGKSVVGERDGGISVLRLAEQA